MNNQKTISEKKMDKVKRDLSEIFRNQIAGKYKISSDEPEAKIKSENVCKLCLTLTLAIGQNANSQNGNSQNGNSRVKKLKSKALSS